MSRCSTSQQIKLAWAPTNAAPPKRKPPVRPRPKQKAAPPRFSPEKHCEAFNRRYRGSVVPEEEWEPFLAVMRAPLPTTFSFTSADCCEVHPGRVQERLESLVHGVQCDESLERRLLARALMDLQPTG